MYCVYDIVAILKFKITPSLKEKFEQIRKKPVDNFTFFLLEIPTFLLETLLIYCYFFNID